MAEKKSTAPCPGCGASRVPGEFCCPRACRGPHGLATLEARFWIRVNKNAPNGCWLWIGSKNPHGYGTLSIKKVHTLAHRKSWEMAHGPIPKGSGYHGVCVLHRCDTPACVNPSHLFLGSVKDNHDDMASKGRRPIGSRHPNSKITEDDVREIRKRLARGESGVAVARRFNLAVTNISMIRNRHTWSHVV